MFILNVWLATAREILGLRVMDKSKKMTHASSNPLIAFLIPSAPDARVPYGSLDDPRTLLSSEIISDSSLDTKKRIKYEGKKAISTTYRSRVKILAILPTAIILFLMIFLRPPCSTETVVGGMMERSSSCSSSSSLEHVFKIATNISVTGKMHQCRFREWYGSKRGVNALFSPTNGKLHVKTSIKFGNQKGCGAHLNCRMFTRLLSYLRTVAKLLYASRKLGAEKIVKTEGNPILVCLYNR